MHAPARGGGLPDGRRQGQRERRRLVRLVRALVHRRRLLRRHLRRRRPLASSDGRRRALRAAAATPAAPTPPRRPWRRAAPSRSLRAPEARPGTGGSGTAGAPLRPPRRAGWSPRAGGASAGVPALSVLPLPSARRLGLHDSLLDELRGMALSQEARVERRQRRARREDGLVDDPKYARCAVVPLRDEPSFMATLLVETWRNKPAKEAFAALSRGAPPRSSPRQSSPRSSQSSSVRAMAALRRAARERGGRGPAQTGNPVRAARRRGGAGGSRGCGGGGEGQGRGGGRCGQEGRRGGREVARQGAARPQQVNMRLRTHI